MNVKLGIFLGIKPRWKLCVPAFFWRVFQSLQHGKRYPTHEKGTMTIEISWVVSEETGRWYLNYTHRYNGRCQGTRHKVQERKTSGEVPMALELNLKDECDLLIWRWEEQRRKKLNWGGNSMARSQIQQEWFPWPGITGENTGSGRRGGWLWPE